MAQVKFDGGRPHVLVVGGNGFIGSHVVDALLAANAQVTVLARSPERYRDPLPGVSYIESDFSDVATVESALASRPDVLIHLGSHHLSLSDAGLPACDLLNLKDSVALFELAIRSGVRKILFMSTGGKIYGRSVELPVKEGSAENPLGSYAITKLAIEKHLQSLALYHGIDAVIVRPSNPFGIRQAPGGRQGVIPIFMKRIQHCEPITIFGGMDMVRDYVRVEDVARFCALAAAQPCQGLFNLGSGVGVSLKQLIDMLQDVLNTEAILHFEPARPFDLPSIVLDCTRAKEVFAWNPETNMLPGLHVVADWLRTLPG